MYKLFNGLSFFETMVIILVNNQIIKSEPPARRERENSLKPTW